MDLRVKRIFEIIEGRFAEEPSEESLCRSVNLCSTRVRQLFKRETGLSPAQYIKDFRVRKAAHFLQTTFLSVKEIAFQCGLKDVSHFVRSFRKRFGLAPSESGFGTTDHRSTHAIQVQVVNQPTNDRFGQPICRASVCAVAAEQPEPALQAELVSLRSSSQRSPRTWRERNSCGGCLAFSRAANAPGVATIWPSENKGCGLVCCMGSPLKGLDFCFRGNAERCIENKCPS